MKRLDVVGPALVMLLVLSACAPEEPTTDAQGPATEWVAAAPYMPAATASEWLSTGANVVSGEVTAIGDSTRISEDLPGSAEPFEAVITLVTVRVDESPSGDLEPGSEINLRFLGGTAGGLQFDWEGAPDMSQLSVGSKIVAVAGPFESKERVTTFTPSVVFLEGDDGYAEDITGQVVETGEMLSIDDMVEVAS